MDGRTIKVLLIGDQASCDATGELLRSAAARDFEILCACDYDAGLRAVESCGHDVVLVDEKIGTRDSLELLSALGNECDAPLIFLAEQEEYEIDVAATRAGAADYLVKKHVNALLLERAIRYAIERKRVETAWRKALRENKKLSEAVANLETGVLITDPRQKDNPIIFANPAVLTITQYSCDEIIGRNCRFLQGAQTDIETRRIMRQAIEAQRPFRGEVLNYRKDGTPFWNELTISPIRENGQVVHFVGLMTDVSARHEDEERLRSSETQLAEAQRIAHVGSWNWDAASEKIVWSDEMFRIFGRKREDQVLTRDEIRSWLHPDDRQTLHSQFLQSCQTLEAFENYHRVLHPDGQVRQVLHRGEVVADEAGGVRAMMGMVQDVTEIKNAEAALQRAHDELEARVEERTQELHESTQELHANAERLRSMNRELLSLTRLTTAEHDLNAMMRAITETAARVMNVSRAGLWVFLEDRSGIRCMDLFQRDSSCSDASTRPKDTRAASRHDAGEVLLARDYPHYFGALKTERSIAVHDACHDARTAEFCEGYLIPHGISSILKAPILKAGALAGVLCHEHVGPMRVWNLEEQTFAASLADLAALALETAERRQAENALREAKEQAEAAQQNAEKANRAKSEFLSRMSHELRTPLNSILGFGQLLQRDELTDKQHERMDLIVSGGHHLLALINEVLDLARVEAGRLELSIEPVRVSEIVAEAVALIAPLAARRGIVLENQTLAETHLVRADRQRFKQVLLNLLSNAVKYNHDDGLVRLWCEVASCETAPEDRLQIKVSNTGAGIAPERLPLLFLPFERLGVVDAIEGTGLGLALSRRLMEAMDGSLEAQSTPGALTTFSCTLPATASPEPSAAAVRAARSRGLADGLRVLYVEDNLLNLKLIENLFADLGCVQLLTAMQGQLGLELAREHLPDLILLDVHLPGMDGAGVLARLQSDARTASIPVVMLSADATTRQIERLLKNGARRYLTKPLDVEEFLRVLSEEITALRARRSHFSGNET